MARKKNSAFVGGTVRDIDVGAASFKRVIENAVGDTALVFDKVAGQHGEANTIIHDGSDGRGCLLGVPIINQLIGRDLSLLGTVPAKGSSGGYGDTWIYAVPFYCPSGETTLLVEVGLKLTLGDDSMIPYVQILDASGTAIDREPLVDVSAAVGEENVKSASMTGLSGGWHILLVGIDTSLNIDNNADNIGNLAFVRARPRLEMGGSPGSFRETYKQVAPQWNDVGGDLWGVTAPAATEGVAHTNFDAALFADLESIDDYTLSRLNRNLNGLLEFITGFPAGGNQTYVHDDQDGGGASDPSNPARSRFEAHTRSLYGGVGTGEEHIDFPLWCEGFGAFQSTGLFAVELVEPPANGMIHWFAPWPTDDTEITIRQIFVPVPDFDSSSSRLQCAVLFGSEGGGGTDPTLYTTKAKTTTGSATNTPSNITGYPLWLTIITAVPFTGDADELLEVHVDRTGAKPAGTAGIGELCVLGAAFAFVKP